MDPLVYERPIVQRLYEVGPLLLQDGLLSAHGLLRRLERRSPVFRRYAAELAHSQWWTPTELQALQEQRLRLLIRHAYEQVPYYRRIFDERRLTPADIRTAEDLYKLPVLTKQDVRRWAPELRARNIPAAWVTVGRTGGTTGYPLRLVLDKQRVIFDRALVHRHWAWAGYRPSDRVVLLRGFTLVAPETRSRIYWRRDWVDNRIYLSGFHLSPTSMPLYVRKLQQWQPRFIAAYPSSLFALARFMEREGLRLPVQTVFTSSEVLTATERRVIEQQFSGRVWDRYGTGERLVVGQQCEWGAYHQNVEFGLLQVDAPRGQPAATGGRGELIHTTLTNLSMPLIRYASEDMGSLVAGRCACGRGLALMGPVDGRKDDVIVTADGRLMPRGGLDLFDDDRAAAAVERCQLVQERPGEIVLRIVPRAGFSSSTQAALVAYLRKQVGEGTRIQVDVMEVLPRTPTGKERLVVSKINVDELLGLQVQAPDEAVSR